MTRAQAIRELGRPVAYYPGLARIVGIEEAIFLMQLIYWSERTDDAEGWVYKTAAEWEQELAMTYTQQARVRTRLKELGVLAEKYKRLKHRMFFRVDWEGYEQLTGRTFGAEAGQGAPEGPQAVLPMEVPVGRKGAVPYAQIYAVLARELPEMKGRSAPARDRNVRKFWNLNGKTIECVEKLCTRIKASDYLNSRNGHKFGGRLDLNWIFLPDKAAAILAGNYDNDSMAFALQSDAGSEVTKLTRVWLVAERRAANVAGQDIGEGKPYMVTGQHSSGIPEVVKVN